jgi:haloalkane dehalogenase
MTMTPGGRERPFDVATDLYPFEDHWFEREGVAMHFIDEGQGPPVVMLHGNPTWSFLYRDVIKQMRDEARCLAPDYPGFGFSESPADFGYTPPEHADWVGAWMKSLDLPPAVLVVQDWGGPIGLSVAVERPEQIAGLVILNSWAWPTDLNGLVFSYLLGGPLGKYLNLERNFFADKILRSGMVRASSKPEAVFDAYRAPFPTPQSRMGTYVFPRAIRQSTTWLESIEHRLKRLRHKPVELVWAMKDRAFGKDEVVARWLQHFPDAAVDRLDDASHYLQEDRPDRIAAAIKRVIRRAQAS